LLRRADEVGACGAGAGLELGAGGGRPAALLADAAHGFVVGRESHVEGFLRGLGDEAVRRDADGELARVMADLVGRAAVELGERAVRGGNCCGWPAMMGISRGRAE